LKTGAEIPIEERRPEEVIFFRGVRVVPKGVSVFNPAFDVTPARYITAFITEKGVVKPGELSKLFKS
jgi:methylthioribose-1-phosphate isomerase